MLTIKGSRNETDIHSLIRSSKGPAQDEAPLVVRHLGYLYRTHNERHTVAMAAMMAAVMVVVYMGSSCPLLKMLMDPTHGDDGDGAVSA